MEWRFGMGKWCIAGVLAVQDRPKKATWRLIWLILGL